MASPTTSSRSPTREALSVADEPHDLARDSTAAEEIRGDGSLKAASVAPSSPGDDEASQESGEASPVSTPAKPAENNDDAPPLPDEPPPPQEDDGWDFHWDEANQSYFFHNRITGRSTWENPRAAKEAAAKEAAAKVAAAGAGASTADAAEPPNNEKPPAGGYNPAIHGDYDPTAWYAQNTDEPAEQSQPVDPAAAYAAIGSFNRFTGRWQGDDQNADQHNDENKSRRQMNAFFDVDAAANAHDGRSLRAERSGIKPSKNELKQFKEKRRARKEEKRRAWLKD